MATVIICPSCGTRYEIAAVLPPEGRNVRCSKCSHVCQAPPRPPLPGEPMAAPPPSEPPVPPMTPPEAPIAQAPSFPPYATEPDSEPGYSSTFEEVPPEQPPEEEETGFYPPARNGQDTFGHDSYAQQDADFDAGSGAPEEANAGEDAAAGGAG